MAEQMRDNRRILVIDDNRTIHEDFRKVLISSETAADMDEDEAFLFGDAPVEHRRGFEYHVDSAYQGSEGLSRVQEAVDEGRPYAMAFVDIRMPPGWDGIETVARIWEVYPELEVVLCTAYSDYSWDDIIGKLGHTDRLLILKKPFDNVEVSQLASSLTVKWNMARQVEQKVEDLEQTVQTRTSELQKQKSYLEEMLEKLQNTQDMLLQAEKMASIGQLAAGVAHEINNPMGFISCNLNTLEEYIKDIKNVILLYDGLLLKYEPYLELAESMDRIRNVQKKIDMNWVLTDLDDLIEESLSGTKRIKQIVGDLRDFSHIDRNSIAPENLNELLDKTVHILGDEMRTKATVVREYGDIPDVPCYGGKLGQVFLNLLINAEQAIEKQGIVTIRTGLQGSMVWIEVSDTGRGISQSDLGNIFNPFFTTKTVGGGTGLGLHLSYTIIQAHGGTISVKSAPGEGTTFRIVIPAAGPPPEEINP